MTLLRIQGAVGLLWFVAWMFIAYDSPAVHPRISPIERKYIQESLKGQMSNTENKKVHLLPIKTPCTPNRVGAYTGGIREQTVYPLGALL